MHNGGVPSYFPMDIGHRQSSILNHVLFYEIKFVVQNRQLKVTCDLSHILLKLTEHHSCLHFCRFNCIQMPHGVVYGWFPPSSSIAAVKLNIA